MAELLQVMTLMAIPAGFLLTIRCLIIRQNSVAARKELASAQAAARRP